MSACQLLLCLHRLLLGVVVVRTGKTRGSGELYVLVLSLSTAALGTVVRCEVVEQYSLLFRCISDSAKKKTRMMGLLL